VGDMSWSTKSLQLAPRVSLDTCHAVLHEVNKHHVCESFARKITYLISMGLPKTMKLFFVYYYNF